MNRKSIFRSLVLTLPVALMGLASSAHADCENLIVNGSFETPNLGGGWNVYGSIPGWTAVITLETPYGIEVGGFGLYGVSNQDGAQVCELDSDGNSRIRQTVATSAGRTYTLKFSTAERAGTNDSAITVYVNGLALGTINPASTEFEEQTYTFTAASASTDIDFEAGGVSDSLGCMLDNVSLTADYSINVLYDQTKAHKRGSTVPVKLQVVDCDGTNLSSSSLTVTAFQVIKVDNSADGLPEDAGNANPDSNFRYDATLGGTGGYIFNLKTTTLTSGTWILRFTVGDETFVREVRFDVK